MVAGHLREGLNRLPLVLLLAAFCLPLFAGLGRTDLENDEAIYSYAVESILATGEWLSPRVSPSADIVFLEKPPLKFWIVAAPIRLGLLPLDEFGLRFWDALFGALAFVYVFLIGRRLAGWICGAAALLVLFAHGPLIFDHGLRSNNMDAALVLAYCGGIYHYLAWASARERRGRHVAAFATYFYLGFMTKFVAALFLPLVIGAVALLTPAHRAALRAHWRSWALAALVVVAASLPWFLYQHAVHGANFWRIIVGEHVYTRFTSSVDPGHVMPWHFYLSEAWLHLWRSGSAGWVALGLAVLAVQAVRHRRADAVVVLLWFVVPVSLISLGTSKLYHYLYPFLPPLALAAGAGVAWIVQRLATLTARWGWSLHAPSLSGGWRAVLLLLACLAAGVAVLTAIEPIRWTLGGRTIFSNHSLMRPLLVALGLAWLAGRAPHALAGGLVLLVALVLPTPLGTYVAHLGRLTERRQPLEDLGACLRQVDASRAARGLPVRAPYAPVADAFLHPQFYYLRGTDWFEEVDDEQVTRALFTPGEERPVLLETAAYQAYLRRVRPAGVLPPAFSGPQVVILLPGEYADCRLPSTVRGLQR
jgi:4-amino-4-deoxy-L-arabinose transferase-like glycosyltransferase